jgi:hypothetical protein
MLCNQNKFIRSERRVYNTIAELGPTGYELFFRFDDWNFFWILLMLNFLNQFQGFAFTIYEEFSS